MKQLIYLVGTLFFCFELQAVIYQVSDSDSIKDVIENRVQNGDTVLIRPGIYEIDPVLIEKFGSELEPIQFDIIAANPSNTILRIPLSAPDSDIFNFASFFLTLTIENITFESLRIGSGDGVNFFGTGFGKDLCQGSNVTFKNCRFKNLSNGIIVEQGNNTCNLRIINCSFEGCLQGTQIEENKLVEIKDSHFEDCETGIFLLDNPSPIIDENSQLKVENCNFENCQLGFFVEDPKKGSFSLTSNMFDNCGIAIKFDIGSSIVSNQSVEITYNSFVESDSSAITFVGEAFADDFRFDGQFNNFIASKFHAVEVLNADLGATPRRLKFENCFWNDDSGPQHEDNPMGEGDIVLGPVDFFPWQSVGIFHTKP